MRLWVGQRQWLWATNRRSPLLGDPTLPVPAAVAPGLLLLCPCQGTAVLATVHNSEPRAVPNMAFTESQCATSLLGSEPFPPCMVENRGTGTLQPPLPTQAGAFRGGTRVFLR